MYDELDELKKVFFEFLKRWTDKDKKDLDPNRPVLYSVQNDEEQFQLNILPELVSAKKTHDNYEETDRDRLTSVSRLEK